MQIYNKKYKSTSTLTKNWKNNYIEILVFQYYKFVLFLVSFFKFPLYLCANFQIKL